MDMPYKLTIMVVIMSATVVIGAYAIDIVLYRIAVARAENSFDDLIINMGQLYLMEDFGGSRDLFCDFPKRAVRYLAIRNGSDRSDVALCVSRKKVVIDEDLTAKDESPGELRGSLQRRKVFNFPVTLSVGGEEKKPLNGYWKLPPGKFRVVLRKERSLDTGNTYVAFDVSPTG